MGFGGHVGYGEQVAEWKEKTEILHPRQARAKPQSAKRKGRGAKEVSSFWFIVSISEQKVRKKTRFPVRPGMTKKERKEKKDSPEFRGEKLLEGWEEKIFGAVYNYPSLI